MVKSLPSIYFCLIFLQFVSLHCISIKPFRCYFYIGQGYKSSNFNLNDSCIYSKKNKSELIIGGDLEEPPYIVKEVQTDESKKFVDDCLKKDLTIKDAIEAINYVPSKDDDLMLDNIFNETKDAEPEEDIEYSNIDENFIDSNDLHSPPIGTVQLDPILDNELLDEEYDEEEDYPEVDFGLLNNSEISIIHTIMKEKVNKPGSDYKSIVLKTIESDPIRYNKDNLMKNFTNLDKFADLFLELNKNVNKPPTDIQWIPKFESKLYRFLKEKNYTLSTCSWTVDSLSITLKEQNLSEKEVSDIHDSVYSYIQDISRTESFSGLTNIGLMVSGDDT